MACLSLHMHAWIQTRIHTYIYTYLCTYMLGNERHIEYVWSRSYITYTHSQKNSCIRHTRSVRYTVSIWMHTQRCFLDARTGALCVKNNTSGVFHVCLSVYVCMFDCLCMLKESRALPRTHTHVNPHKSHRFVSTGGQRFSKGGDSEIHPGRAPGVPTLQRYTHSKPC
jgi:hypothetical protein